MRDEYDKVVAELAVVKESIAKGEELIKELEAANVIALQEKNEVYLQLEAERSVGGDAESRFHAVMAQKIDVESTLKDVEERLMDEEDANASLGATKKKMEEGNRKAAADLQAEEDKVNHLSKV